MTLHGPSMDPYGSCLQKHHKISLWKTHPKNSITTEDLNHWVVSHMAKLPQPRLNTHLEKVRKWEFDPPEWIFQWGGIWVCTKAENFRNSRWSSILASKWLL
jgi:hypothetical protein